MKMIHDIFIVADENFADHVVPYQKEDQFLLQKYRRVIKANFGEWVFTEGYYKITVESSFFGLIKKVTLEKLKMSI